MCDELASLDVRHTLGFRRLVTGSWRVLVVLGDQLDGADDVGVEFRQVFGWYPILQDRAAAHLVELIAVDEGPPDTEAGHVAAAGVHHSPRAGDLRGVVLVQHRIEDRLLRQPRWPLAPARCRDQG